MDSLKCQRIRKLTALYKQLKLPVSTIERIEFISELADALKAEPHSPLLSEVNTISLKYAWWNGCKICLDASTISKKFSHLSSNIAHRFTGQRTKITDC